jgi:hypothetical protein
MRRDRFAIAASCERIVAGIPVRAQERSMNAPAPNASVFGNDNIVVQASGSDVNVRRAPVAAISR